MSARETPEQKARDLALTEIGRLPLTEAEWIGLAVLVANLAAAGNSIEILRGAIRQALGEGE